MSSLIAQEITILDKITQERIPSVKIYSNSPKVQQLANIDGRFKLDFFMGCDSIYIDYRNYEILIFSYDELKLIRAIELDEKHLSVSEMIVSANRWEQDKAKVPSRIVKLKLKDLSVLEPQTSADLLEASGYVFVQKSQFAGGSPQLRGFGTNRVMIVVDGVRMNNAIFRSGNLQNIISLDANSLESAEVQFGPGAVIYGSDAIGGVMNFTTKRPVFSPDSTKNYVKTTLFSRYSSSSNESTSNLSFSLGNKKWASFTAFNYSNFGDLKAGEHGNSTFLRPSYQSTVNGADTTLVNKTPRIQRESAYSQYSLLHNVDFKPSEKWFLSYGLNYSKSSDAPRYDRLTEDKNNDGILDKAEWYYGPQEWMMHKLTIVNSPVNNTFYEQLRIGLAYQNYKESRHDRKTGATTIRRQFEEVNAFSLNVDLNKKLNHKTNLFYGLEGVFNQVKSKAYREAKIDQSKIEINPRYPDGSTWQTYGVYANLVHSINEKWDINGGIRFSIYDIKASFDTTLFTYPVTAITNNNSALNGSAGLVYNPNMRTQFYVNASTGFRAPNIDDIGKVFDSEPGIVIVPNINLKPEYAYNAEVGFVKMLKGIFKVDGAVYYTYLQDALARSSFAFDGQDSILYEGVLSQVVAVQNVSDAYVYGIQGGVEFSIAKGLTLKSSISYQRGFEYSLDSARYFPKSHVAPTFGRTALAYKRRHMHLEFYVVYQAEVKNKDFPLGDLDDLVYARDESGLAFTPSWYTINLKGAYFFNKHISINAGLENITNQLYRTFGSGISASGLNATISIKAIF